jgi:hypothetical protein
MRKSDKLENRRHMDIYRIGSFFLLLLKAEMT